MRPEACDPTYTLSKDALSEPGMVGERGEGARLPAAVLDSLLSKSIGEYVAKGELVQLCSIVEKEWEHLLHAGGRFI
jgi:hypothetical protein